MRIWFNHWFSTAYHLINLIKLGDPEKFSFVGSGTNPLAVYLEACDEKYSEPNDISEKDYVDFCLEFCREKKIDIFIPRRGLTAICERAEDFANAGTRLFADKNAKLLRVLESKTKTYDFFLDKIPRIVPKVRTVRSVNEFKAAYEELKSSCGRVCYKLEKDEGARSFRVIDENTSQLCALLNAPNTKVSPETALEILSRYDFSIPVLVMPYLSGQEISADCLKTSSENIILPRYKNGRYSKVVFDRGIMELCQEILDIIDIEMPLNIQFKLENEKPFLLEINTRMSGGLQLSCKATGINIPSIAVNRLLGKEIPWSFPKDDIPTVVNLETPVCIGE